MFRCKINENNISLAIMTSRLALQFRKFLLGVGACLHHLYGVHARYVFGNHRTEGDQARLGESPR